MEVLKVEVNETFLQIRKKVIVTSSKIGTWCIKDLEPETLFLLTKVNVGQVKEIIVPSSIVVKTNNLVEIFIPLTTKTRIRQVLKPGTTIFKCSKLIVGEISELN